MSTSETPQNEGEASMSDKMDVQDVPIGTAASVEPSSAVRNKIRRRARNTSCTNCVKQKTRCLPSIDPNKCERCHHFDRECITRAPKGFRLSVNGGEESPLASGDHHDATPFDPDRVAFQATPSAEANITVDSLLKSPDLRHKGSTSFTTLFSRGLKLGGKYTYLLRGLDHLSVQEKFDRFGQYAQHFPFINPNQSDDSVQCILYRPLFTLAVCAVTTAYDRDAQLRFSKAVRLSVSERAVLSNDQEIDLLLGLMVYLAWNHHYLDQLQLSQLLGLLAGLAADNGIYRPLQQDVRDYQQAAFWERERALIGCYYLCSMLPRCAMNNPGLLRWSESIQQRANYFVGCNHPLPSDKKLRSFVELALALEEFSEAYQRPPPGSEAGISFKDLQARATQQRLRSLRRTLHAIASEPICTASMIEVYQNLMAENGMNSSDLIQCACTIKEYIDDLLSRPATVLHQISAIDFANLLNIIVLTAKISKPLPSSGSWEAGALMTMLPPEDIMRNIAVHMESGPADDASRSRNSTLTQFFKQFCELVKQQILTPPPYPPNAGSQFADALKNGVFDAKFLREFMRIS